LARAEVAFIRRTAAPAEVREHVTYEGLLLDQAAVRLGERRGVRVQTSESWFLEKVPNAHEDSHA
jgi:hypothetical protein